MSEVLEYLYYRQVDLSDILVLLTENDESICYHLLSSRPLSHLRIMMRIMMRNCFRYDTKI
jgi:hypothetical protein